MTDTTEPREHVGEALNSTRFVGLVGAASILGAPQGIFEVPVVIDLDARTVTPVPHPFMDGTFDVGSTSILAVEIPQLSSAHCVGETTMPRGCELTYPCPDVYRERGTSSAAIRSLAQSVRQERR